MLLLIWLGSDFLVLGIAHAFGAHRIFGKKPEGTFPLWSRVAFLPLLAYTNAVWYLLQAANREPATNTVSEQVTVGRRLRESEIDQTFDNFVDLTAEFAEPTSVRQSPSYLSFPILDGSAPDPGALLQAIKSLRKGTTFIHCAQGHGRTGLFALAVLLKSGTVRSVEEGLQLLKTARPGIRLNSMQRACAEAFARRME